MVLQALGSNPPLHSWHRTTDIYIGILYAVAEPGDVISENLKHWFRREYCTDENEDKCVLSIQWLILFNVPHVAPIRFHRILHLGRCQTCHCINYWAYIFLVIIRLSFTGTSYKFSHAQALLLNCEIDNFLAQRVVIPYQCRHSCRPRPPHCDHWPPSRVVQTDLYTLSVPT